MTQRILWIISAAFVLALGQPAIGVQLQDEFDNATYDNGLNSTLWWTDAATTSTAFIHQDGAKDELQIGGFEGDGAAHGIISKNMIDFGSADRNMGTQIDIVVNQIEITRASDNWRDMNMYLFLVDEAVQDSNNHYTYPTASTVFYNDIKGNNAFLSHSMWTKDDSQDNNGWWTAERRAPSMPTGTYTFPLHMTYFINQYYAVLQVNGQYVYTSNFQNLTGAGLGFTNNRASLRLWVENGGASRGIAHIGSITVGDAGATPMPLPAPINASAGLVSSFGPDAYDGKLNSNKFYLFGAGPWGTAVQNAGALTITSPEASYEEAGIATREVALGASDNLQVSYDVQDFSQRIDEGLNGNMTLSVIDGGLNSFAYVHYARAAFNIAMIRQYNSNQIDVLTFSKSFGSSFAQGPQLQEQLVSVNQIPFKVKLVFDHANYELRFDDQTVVTGKHNITFGDQVAVQLSARNEGNDSRTTLKIDNFNLGINGPGHEVVDTPNAARDWTLY